MVIVDSAAVMRLMRQKQWGTYELAKRAGIRAATLLRALEGRSPTQIMTVFKLGEALDVNYNDLITAKLFQGETA